MPPAAAATTSTRADYVAMLERLGRGVGALLEALREQALVEKTIVIFTNDNGGVSLSNSAPLFHRKFSAWEGGIRVPAIIRWPGRLPRGKVSHQVGITMDLTASILAASNADVAADARLEGIDLFPILEGRVPEVTRTLFWRTGGVGPANLNQKAIRSGEWKLISDQGHQFLFNVRTDPSERHDLLARRPEVANRLRRLLAE